MSIILETERLQLRRFTKQDAAFIVALLNTPGWLQFIGDRNVRTEEEAIRYLEKGPLDSYERNGFGLSLGQLKEGAVPIGMFGLLKRKELSHEDIGFALLPQYAGMGYAYEMAAAILDHAFHDLKLPKLLAIVNPENDISIRLLEKLGMQPAGLFEFENEKKELRLFEIHTDL